MSAELVEQKKAPDIRTEIQKMEPQFKLVLPPHITSERFVRIALTALQKNPDLIQADRKSLLGACMLAAQDGLLPDSREGAIVVYKLKDGTRQATWMPMVGGILKKVRNSGELQSLSPHVVYEGDEFTYYVDENGEHLKHVPKLFEGDGKFLAAYAIAKTKDGGVYIEVMNSAQVERVRSASRARNSGPWTEWYPEMAKKCVIRRLAKRLPMSTDLEEVLRRDDELYDFSKPVERIPYVAPEYMPNIKPQQTIQQFVDRNKQLSNAKEFFAGVISSYEQTGLTDWAEKLRREINYQTEEPKEIPDKNFEPLPFEQGVSDEQSNS